MLKGSSMERWVVVAMLACSVVISRLEVQAESLPEKPLALTADDPQLKWGPCPPFLPKGCDIAVLHGDPAKSNADVFLRIPPNYTIPPHWHTSAERMVLVSGELKVEYTGHSPSTLKPGTYAYGPAKAPHRGSCAATRPCVLFIAFESPVDGYPVEGAPE
jgi:quercetin dioxygenase-like cupin family protein